MYFYYAQLNFDDVADGISCLNGEVVAENMISITEEQYSSQSVLYYKYNRATGGWGEYCPPSSGSTDIPVVVA